MNRQVEIQVNNDLKGLSYGRWAALTLATQIAFLTGKGPHLLFGALFIIFAFMSLRSAIRWYKKSKTIIKRISLTHPHALFTFQNGMVNMRKEILEQVRVHLQDDRRADFYTSTGKFIGTLDVSALADPENLDLIKEAFVEK